MNPASSSASTSSPCLILDRSADGDLGARLATLATITGIPGLGSGLVLIVALVAILASLAQMGLMLVRIGVVTILAGTLPLSAAGTATDTGRAWFQRVLAWLLAFVLYKPAAATVYASAFLLVGKGQDAASVLSGLFLMILAIVALPALLRLVTPAVAAATSSGAGGGAAAGVTAAATGARMAADRGGMGAAPPPPGPHQPGLVRSPSGAPPGRSPTVPGPRPGGPDGSHGSSAAAGSAGAAGSAAATGTGAATAGASVVVHGVVGAAGAGVNGARSAAGNATGDDSQNPGGR